MAERRFSGTRVREVRESVSMTQDGLSLVSGLSVRTIAYTESGDRAPTAATLAKLARGLGVKMSAFWVEDKVA